MTYAYSMDDAVQVANQAATDIEAWLWGCAMARSAHQGLSPDYSFMKCNLHLARISALIRAIQR
ncbi:MAG: hypothetical protein V7K35_01275 [Nostoc sp.]|uniref:hypothetical protein n=1 Tax=Nostoc sp. TaxID=1180 RepID=UPI002FFC1E8D